MARDGLSPAAKVALICAAAAMGTVILPVGAVGAFGMLGFSSGGVVAGSLAASIQSVVYGGSIASGSVFAFAQSLTTGGVVATTATSALGGISAATTAGALLFRRRKPQSSSTPAVLYEVGDKLKGGYEEDVEGCVGGTMEDDDDSATERGLDVDANGTIGGEEDAASTTTDDQSFLLGLVGSYT